MLLDYHRLSSYIQKMLYSHIYLFDHLKGEGIAHSNIAMLDLVNLIIYNGLGGGSCQYIILRRPGQSYFNYRNPFVKQKVHFGIRNAKLEPQFSLCMPEQPH